MIECVDTSGATGSEASARTNGLFGAMLSTLVGSRWSSRVSRIASLERSLRWTCAPELAACLFEPVATDRRGEVPPGAKPYFEIPVFNWFASRLSVIYQRQYIDSAQRFPDVPRLSAQQRAALDLLDALADDPALHFMMDFEAGDMQFVHNHTLLHDRTAYEDWPERERRRHLLRLWLAPPSARPLPPVFAQRYGNVVAGYRGGVPSADGRLSAGLDLGESTALNG